MFARARWSFGAKMITLHDRCDRGWASRPEWPEGPFSKFVRIFSPWVPGKGYKRIRLRWWLYALRHPRYRLGSWIRSRILRFTNRWWIGPGRYEANSFLDRPKVAWLDGNSELADREAGDVETVGHVRLFRELPVPWSRDPETWTLMADVDGFCEGHHCRNAVAGDEIVDEIEKAESEYEEVPDGE